MIKDFAVDELFESSFNGALVVDVIEMLQRMSDKHGHDATMHLDYDYDDCLRFNIMAPRQETKFEEDVRVQLELYAQQSNEVWERTEYQRLKGKYGS